MLLTLAWGLLGVATVWGSVLALRRRAQSARTRKLRAEWGRVRERDRDMKAISQYYRGLTPHERASRALNDRTWDDLNMDDVFAVLDRTESVVGQQVLYARLRAASLGDHLAAFESLVTRMSEDSSARERAQQALGRLSAPAGYDLWWLAQPGSIETSGWHRLFPVLGVSMLGVVALVPFWPAAALLLVAGAIANLVVRVTVTRRLQMVAGVFRQVAPLVAAANALASLNDPTVAPIIGPLSTDGPRLSRLRRIAGWAGRTTTAAPSGDLGAILFEYLNLLFCVDANALFFGARELRARGPQLLRVIAAVGDVDAAVSVASFRAGSPGWTRPTFQPAGAPAVLVGICHPLLPDAVPNTITLAPPNGVIVTGSNMSGKSTFLRTVGVTAVLAQTINTCKASRYEAPVFVVRSCIGRADDPATGKSYYLVEVEAVLELVHAARAPAPHLMLFDELFRGTNAVERIAAGAAVLATLLASGTNGHASPHVVIAATHDQELVDLLEGSYAAFHFADTIDEAGLAFDYQIQPGPATTRNAIALLGQRGAPPELVAEALARAQTLDRARRTALTG